MNTAQKITHILDRLSFGARPGDRQRLEHLGAEAYIQQQIAPGRQLEPIVVTERIKGFTTLQLSSLDLFEQYRFLPDISPDERRRMARRQQQILQEMVQTRLLRAIYSPHQLQELMVDFWFNHFNVVWNNGQNRIWTGTYEREAIRPYALGRFRDLLGATAKHPAMLFYLDNWRNTDPNSPGARGPFRGLNENYAREVLELHTMGVNGSYTQADVETLTRILTGWSFVQRRDQSPDGSAFKFFTRRHDSSNKVFLGRPISGGGIEEGELALDLLAQHPSTARHISYKLAQYFVADTPPPSLVEQLANRFLATDGNIKEVLSSLLSSPDFWDKSYYQQKFKTPYQYLISLARAIGWNNVSATALRRLSGAMQQLGMPVYGCRTPDGYAQTEAAWLSPDAMLRRVSFAIASVNIIPDSRPDPDDLLTTLGEEQLSFDTLAVVDSAPKLLRSSLILGSPEMMYR